MPAIEPDLHEAFERCRAATHELIREARAFAERLEEANSSSLTDDELNNIELQRVLVDEAHSRYTHIAGILAERARRN